MSKSEQIGTAIVTKGYGINLSEASQTMAQPTRHAIRWNSKEFMYRPLVKLSNVTINRWTGKLRDKRELLKLHLKQRRLNLVQI